MRGKAIHLQLSTSMSLRRGINGFWGFSWLVGFLLKKKPQQRKLRMKIKMEVNSILIFDYNIKVNPVVIFVRNVLLLVRFIFGF